VIFEKFDAVAAFQLFRRSKGPRSARVFSFNPTEQLVGLFSLILSHVGLHLPAHVPHTPTGGRPVRSEGVFDRLRSLSELGQMENVLLQPYLTGDRFSVRQIEIGSGTRASLEFTASKDFLERSLGPLENPDQLDGLLLLRVGDLSERHPVDWEVVDS